MEALSLPRGITGFAPKGNVLPWIDAADFKRMCDHVVRSIGIRIGRVDSAEGQVARNFHIAEVQIDSRWISVLCNAHHPWLALAEPTDVAEFGPRAFAQQSAEVIVLTQALQKIPNVRVLDIALLEAAPKPAVLAGLWACEVKQIRSWKPQRIGDIIFNTWD